jgi:hypothetical protein
MHVVALTRWNSATTLEHELPALAKALAMAPYDARLKLVAPSPALLATNMTPERAAALVATLRQRGHGAVECDARSVPRSAVATRGFALTGDALSTQDEQQRAIHVAYAAITCVLRAAEESSQSHTLETSEKKLAVASAVLTGGLKMSKTVTSVAIKASAVRQEVAYVFYGAGAPTLLLKEYALNYEALGSARGTTAHQSFQALIAWLRRHAPNAMHDDRMLSHKRRSNALIVRGAQNDRSVSQSNASENDLGAYLLMRAREEQQL